MGVLEQEGCAEMLFLGAMKPLCLFKLHVEISETEDSLRVFELLVY